MAKIPVTEIIGILRRFSPENLAYDWDNTGIQIGSFKKNAERILLTLDLTSDVVQFAIKGKYDLIITHHPVFFKPLKKVVDSDILSLIKSDISVYTMHTNLDLVSQGVNYCLAEKIGLKKLKPLKLVKKPLKYHLVCYVPEDSVNMVSDAVFSAGAGKIGNYSNCMNTYPVKGQFIPLQGSNPKIGSQNNLETVDEIKLEFFVDHFNIETVIEELIKAHPYETPVYAVYPLENLDPDNSLGLIGEVDEDLTLLEIAEKIKKDLSCPYLEVWTAGKMNSYKIKRVAVCGGSGSSLLNEAEKKADCYLTSDLTYHSYINYSKPLFLLNHYYAEFPVLRKVREILSENEIMSDILPVENHGIKKLKVL